MIVDYGFECYVCYLCWKNFGWLIKADLLPFFSDFLEATDTITIMFTFADMFTFLKGLDIFPVQLCLWGIFRC